MDFRRAQQSDQAGIENVVFSTLKEYGLEPDPDLTDKDLSALDEFYFSCNGYFEVYLSGDEVVGTWGIHPLSNESCELRKMYLLKNHRGQGIGKIMMARAFSKAKELGFKKMELHTSSSLKEAVSLYEKYGFKQVARELPCRCDLAYELELCSPADQSLL